MPFQITITRSFSASHQLQLYNGSLEPLHGHNWRIGVTVQAPQLDDIGVVMDFHSLERRVDRVMAGWHNSHLNDQTHFQSINPTAENVALTLGKHLRLPAKVQLVSVEVWETSGNCARYLP